MKAKNHFYILICLLSLRGFSQDRGADSLKKLLAATQNDSVRVKRLLELSSYYLNSSTELAKSYAQQALELSQQLKFNPGRALALKNIGIAYYFQGNTAATLDYYGQSLHLYDSMGDLESKARMLNNFGTVYYTNGSDDKALENYFSSLEVAEKIDDKAGIATAYSNIANVYLNKRATTYKALDFFLKALQISEKIGEKNIIGGASVNLGEIYNGLGKYDSALYYYNESMLAFANTINLPYPIRGIGNVYAKKKDFVNAIKYNKEAYKIAEQFDSKLAMAQALNATGDVYVMLEDYTSSLAYYKSADSIARIIPAYKELDDAYAGLALSYSKSGDYNNAYKYQKLFSSVADTLNNQTLSDKLTSLQKNFEIQSRQNEINLLTKDKKVQELELKNQKTQKAFILGALFLIFIIAFVLYRGYRNKVKTNRILDEQKDQIEGLLLNILPAEVATELQQTGSSTPRFYDQVSVLFTDFKGFTLIADELSPQEVVSELDACFIAFDGIIEKYNLEKIKTIGDSYMCAGGIPSENPDHPVNMIMAGLEIRDWTNNLNKRRTDAGLAPWELRIGIHVGPAVAGVVGRKKFAYDIWGSTVNIASRMESSGKPGLVNISAAAYELVKHQFSCVYRGKIMAKNIGEIDMYFVEGPLSEN